MPGPSVKRLDTSPVPGLQQPAVDLLTSLLGGRQTPGAAGPSRMGTGNPMIDRVLGRGQGSAPSGPQTQFDPDALSGLMGRLGLTTPLQQQTADVFSNFLAQPTAQQRTLTQAQGPLGELLAGRGVADPSSVLNAATPLFQRNLTEQLGALNEAGPRFASTAAREGTRLRQDALTDFNLFAQQTLEAGRQRQLQAQLGAASTLGGLAGGADQSVLAGAQAAGQFGLGQQQLNLAALMPLLQQLFGAGGLNSAPGFVQQPGFLGQVAGLAGGLGSAALGLGGGLSALGIGGGGGGNSMSPEQAALIMQLGGGGIAR